MQNASRLATFCLGSGFVLVFVFVFVLVLVFVFVPTSLRELELDATRFDIGKGIYS